MIDRPDLPTDYSIAIERRRHGALNMTMCNDLHVWTHSLPRFQFPFDKNAIPLNGIYILFEKGELAHGTDRIVRVGTHTGEKQLRSRLLQHFLIENKDRSIFRKNIGRALLNREHDPYLAIWNIDRTSRQTREKHEHIDLDRQREVERDVTAYIQEHFSFVVFPVEEKAKRLGACLRNS